MKFKKLILKIMQKPKMKKNMMMTMMKLLNKERQWHFLFPDLLQNPNKWFLLREINN